MFNKNVDNTDVFSCCYDIKDFFPVSRIQLMSRRAGAGREHRETAGQGSHWKYCIP